VITNFDRLLVQSSTRIEEELKNTILSLRSNLSSGEALVGMKDDSHNQQIEQLVEKNFKLENELSALKDTNSDTQRVGLKQVNIGSLQYF
jgi:hypothetical protein